MKIGIATFNAPWHHIGGVETHAWEVSKALAYLGNDVHFFYTGPVNKNDKKNNVYFHQIRIYGWKRISPNKQRINLPLYNLAVNKKIKKININIFHSQNFDGIGLIRNRCPIVITIHTVPYLRYTNARKNFPHGIANTLLTLSEHYKCKYYSDRATFISISEKVQQELKYIYNIDSTVIPNGVNEPEIIPQEIAREKLGISDWDKVILFFSRITKEKAPHKLLSVLKENKKFGLIVGGTGDFVDELKKIVRKEGLQNRVKILGYVKPKDKKYIFSAADCFALPSEQVEGQPITILEAMSYGLPCYVTDINWVPLYLRKYAVEGKVTEGVMKALEMGKQNIPVMSWIDVAKKLQEIYEEILEESGEDK